MTEKEKMLAGKYYIHKDEELRSMSRKCREAIYEFNFSSWEQSEYRIKILNELFGYAGKNISILQTFKCCYGSNIRVGDNFFANYDCVFLDVNSIEIGDNVLLGPRVMLLTAGHPIDKDIRNQHLEYGLPINIGNDVWIGAGTIVNPGKNIGSDSVIGSGSVVTHDIPSGVVAAGNPCKVIREISEMDILLCQQKRDEYFSD